MQDSGFALDIVDNGKQAVQKLAAHDYDIILMDVNMPEMDGYAATAHIRANLGAKSNIPIIIITCLCSTREKAKSMLLGANTFVSKPINARELLDEITTLVVNKPLYL
ncbi:MAG: hypothetical protein AVDCRST_MAG95-1790 [uncultured Adhaeribacter sp.]|uniref:Response regulatory domain-containing protein n=1 Tax=uncultured Adhaeribacter sp. TaxID=448109 RepID=A0A6J4IG19_9BACT|nr:MAG: hypothetical protein AVDCRST_MAG95-1790 [uncultured Adhaeribacter sp.]